MPFHLRGQLLLRTGRRHYAKNISPKTRSSLPTIAKNPPYPKKHIQASSIELFVLVAGCVGWGAIAGLSLHSYLSEDDGGHFGSTSLSSVDLGWNTKPKPDMKKAMSLLRNLFPEEGKVITDPKSLKSYSETKFLAYIGSQDAQPHKVIVFPTTTEDVVKIVKVANNCNVPIVPRGSGTGLEGHSSNITDDNICVDLSNMNTILQINENDSDLVCQAGATWDDINHTLQDSGIKLFFPLDPAPGATIGGMMATSCSGTNAVRYGTARAEWFLSATVVLPSGEVIKTRRRAHKSSAGFDLTQLFIGSEGTLGIITEVAIRLAPLLPSTVAVAHFPNVENACSAVDALLKSQYGVHIQCVELADSIFMEALNHSLTSSGTATSYPASDSLFIKLQGDKDTLRDVSRVTKQILERHGSMKIQFANGNEEARTMWDHRKGALLAILGYIKDSEVWSTDVCVPVSNLPKLVRQVQEDAATMNVICPIVGHVGDGNFHAALIYRSKSEFKNVQELSKRIVERALTLDGTCTGEHGVGVGKRHYLAKELGDETVKVMRTIKRTIDPKDLMNPGKLYPPV
ncbi:hypothetical protein FRC16_001548 [Serendipita sp. 398]|nr:hypothetical protein FRC16_001548 [Serendipita sp. 398]